MSPCNIHSLNTLSISPLSPQFDEGLRKEKKLVYLEQLKTILTRSNVFECGRVSQVPENIVSKMLLIILMIRVPKILILNDQPFALLVLLAELAADGDQLALVLLALLVHRLLKRQW